MLARVLFPEPLGPMMAWTSPGAQCERVRSLEDLGVADAGVEVVDLEHGGSGRRGLADAALEGNGEELARLHGELHGELVEDLLGVAIDDQVQWPVLR